jgi:hypothetical protein
MFLEVTPDLRASQEKFIINVNSISRSQWPRCLKYELSSLARTLGTWIRIPLKTWMSVCVCVVLCVGRSLATGWSPVQGVLPTVYGWRNWKKRPRSTSAVEHTDIHASNRIRTHDPIVRMGEDGSCLWLRSHCDRQDVFIPTWNPFALLRDVYETL